MHVLVKIPGRNQGLFAFDDGLLQLNGLDVGLLISHDTHVGFKKAVVADKMHGGLIDAFRQNVYSEATRLVGSRAPFAANPIHSTTATSACIPPFLTSAVLRPST